MSAAEVSLLAVLSVSVFFNAATVSAGVWLLLTGRIGTGRVYDPTFAARDAS